MRCSIPRRSRWSALRRDRGRLAGDRQPARRRLQGRHLCGQSTLSGRARLQMLRQRRRASEGRRLPRGRGRGRDRLRRAGRGAGARNSRGGGAVGGVRRGRASSTTGRDRVRAVADKGMAICGPNCFGIINVRSGAASFSGRCAEGDGGGPCRAGLAKRQPRQFRVQPAGARPQARLQPFHLVRQPDRHDGRGLCRCLVDDPDVSRDRLRRSRR